LRSHKRTHTKERKLKQNKINIKETKLKYKIQSQISIMCVGYIEIMKAGVDNCQGRCE